MSWDPDHYLRFADHRLRPALDLLARVGLEAPERVVDLGCGAGNVTRVLRERWPAARLSGVDASPEMLQRAATVVPGVEWIESRIEAWSAADPVTLIYSNAALHWVDDHPSLFARLASSIAPGGVLAVQMPANFEAPSHRLIRELAASEAWAGRLAGARMGAVMEAGVYHRLLSSCFERVDLWETVYWQRLEGEGSVLNWLAGTTLLPYFALLDEAERERFSAELGRALAVAYPAAVDGSVLFPFRRLFFVAQR